MRSNTHKAGRLFGAIMVIGFVGAAVPNGSAFAEGVSHVSTTVPSERISNNPINPLAPGSDGAVGTIDLRVPVIPVGQYQPNCHLTNHKGVDCQ